MAKIGRNDPCYCGSGKKYKHCHLQQDRAAERVAAQVASARLALYDRLLAFSRDHDKGLELTSAFDLFWNGCIHPDDVAVLSTGQLNLFMEWFLLDYLRGQERKTALQLFVEREGPSLAPLERQILEAWDQSRISLYQVGQVRDGVIEIEDLLRGGQAKVRFMAPGPRAGTVMITRVFQEPDTERVGRGVIAVPEDRVSGLVALAQERFQAYQEQHYQATWEDFLRASAYVLIHPLLDEMLPPPPVEKPEPEDEAAIIKEIVRQMESGIITGSLEQHYARWADTPVPAWRNRTPRQMLRTHGGRRLVEAVLDELERVEEAKRMLGQPFYDVDHLRRILGLIEEERPVGGGVLVG
jgi:hypothetical protein